MNKRLKKKFAYKKYMRDIFNGYETMLQDESVNQLTFTYLKENTILSRDKDGQIHFLTKDI
ncbi:hypothetical protein M2139_001174 [Enterococcus sp. PF1-24]|uniref:hypothetical protein n=1 Tax=unclassified Enterococcus TaxID=2608891 RepID=UPI0024752117|nr:MULTISPECIES: hypothetical protein [unclassified Enterococcus]MDH6364189.1 hypothetical protein [Enterococcus sp. PFB1-1]MDH6401290.1 hypothetical protein [Enterococcus sp. PF1-24]